MSKMSFTTVTKPDCKIEMLTKKCMICDTCMTNCVRRNKYLNKNFVNTFLYWAVCKSIYIGGVK